MMPIRLMHRIVRFTSAGHLPPVAARAAARWEAEPGSLVYVRSSANHVFRFSRANAPVYLRLSPAPERPVDFLQSELDWLRDLHARGLPVADPVPSSRGAWIETLSDPQDGLDYHAAAFTALQGLAWLEPEKLTAAQRRVWGRLAARLHTAGAEYQPSPGVPRRPDWRERWLAAHDALPEDETAARRVLTEGITWLDEIAHRSEPWGLIHGDLELDNLVWDGSTAGGEGFAVLDFDDCGYGPPAADLALALRDVWVPPDGGPEAQEILSAYVELRPLPPEVAEQIERVLHVERALQFARLLHAFAGMRPEEDPDWSRPLRARLEPRIAGLRAAF